VAEVVKRHGAEIKIGQGQEGTGTQITIAFPIS